MWGFIWLIIAFCFFALGIIVGLVAFKVSYIPGRLLRLSAATKRGLQENAAQQKADSADFLPVPGSKSSAALSLAPTNSYLELGIFVLLCAVGFVI